MKAGEGRVSSSGCSNMIENDLEMASVHKVSVRPPESMLHCIEGAVKETLFPDDPFRQFKNQPAKRKCFLGVQYLFPILEWAPKYSLKIFKSDLISGITIASLAIPQGISYAKLANLPPILGLYSSFVPPLIYAMLGSSRDLAVGTVAVVSLLIGSLIAKEISPAQNPQLALHLALTATFFAGIFQASMGIFRLGFVIDFLSHATIVGFMAGAATVVSLQQLKGILGLQHFTTETDIVSAMRSVWGQTHKVGHLKSGLNPLTVESFMFEGKYLKTLVKTGLIIGIITLTEGIAVGRTFALFKNYNIDGNKEMIAIGMMNIVGSCTSCYITTGAFSRSAVNFNAGCKTAVSNIVMAIAVMITLLFLTPLFHYTPLVVLSSIIISAMLGLIDIPAAYHLWKVDKVDFLVCMGAYVGVVFGNIEIGLIIAVTISLLRLILHVSRPHTAVLGNIPNTTVYRNAEQYPDAARVPGILILRIDAPIYFSNASYLRERIMRWIMDEEERLAKMKEDTLQYVIIDMAPVTTVDTSGIRMLEELKKTVELTGLQLALSNPGSDLMEKLEKAKFTEFLGPNWLFLTVGEGVAVCSSLLQARKLNG
ncbi:sulfate transporter 3.1 isoform X2 [Cryptomeria japonica]|uniref:sulfate transporter 3.1 isoform X2 n=1 Tax=Cryptomeria japonica TaxID=3369 RepID=UPI0027D9D4A5|nr:sulfate transporter 3.1 isoform X2 [Cryptomeria japonica]